MNGLIIITAILFILATVIFAQTIGIQTMPTVF